MAEKTKIIFVCLGNIVRSPLAENMFRHLAEQRGVAEKYEIDSAGTSAYHIGESPDARMRRVAEKRGFKYSGRARQFKPSELEAFDLVIAMDQSNAEELRRMARSKEEREKIRLLLEFDPNSRPNEPVPDPYYGGIDGFENVFDLVERASMGLLDALENGKLHPRNSTNS